jgi:muramidase (phage lysozyme)
MIAPALKAFLDLIAWSEGTNLGLDDGYGMIVSGIDGPHSFTDYSDHPFAPQFSRAPVIVRKQPLLESTAAGRYQLLYRWWNPYKAMLRLPDFTPASQDAVAIQQIKEKAGLELIADLNIEGAIIACSNIWASLPGNSYGEPGGHSMESLLEQYKVLSENQA